MGQVETPPVPASLTLQQAAAQAGCSVKTLYRLMQRGRLSYHKGGDNRRYVSEARIRELFPAPSVKATGDLERELQELRETVQELAQQLEAQTEALNRLIRLYQPQDLGSLLTKHWPEKSDLSGGTRVPKMRNEREVKNG
ncbi:helix-turn-helix domain-containing protein [Ectothiorhodospira variabilis]|uniref:helix-turn-helix domain-containing protein n=1 Tax=Ectothiorhodospira variabilis TaxID=505694 RepID=UPI0023788FBE|nr:helix-turn-helix domain-containing protein [Ectothiorhodospira variabilis]